MAPAIARTIKEENKLNIMLKNYYNTLIFSRSASIITGEL